MSIKYHNESLHFVVSQIESVCSPDHLSPMIRPLTHSSLYISTPNYPNHSPRLDDQSTCATTIRVTPGQRIRLTLLDLDLGYSYNEKTGTFHCKVRIIYINYLAIGVHF